MEMKCPRCGKEKKTNQGIYCQPCATHFSTIKRLKNQACSGKWFDNKKQKGYKLWSKARNRKVSLAPIGKEKEQ